jgi:hypothetical protein
MKSRFFATGILAFLAFSLLWAVGNRGPRVWLPIVIAIFGAGSVQAIYGKSVPCRLPGTADRMEILISLWMEEPTVSALANADIPMIELQPVDSSDDEDPQ